MTEESKDTGRSEGLADEAYIEAAARHLCEIRGQDPDEDVPHGHPSGLAILLYSPRWRLVANEVRARLQMDEALRRADTNDGAKP